jgi:hypothetical protein
MGRIKINDLPVLEELQMGELKGIFGGWSRFRFRWRRSSSGGRSSSTASAGTLAINTSGGSYSGGTISGLAVSTGSSCGIHSPMQTGQLAISLSPTS